ncbi:cupredoxin domain-containing protein [Candidatus Pelagibacter sp.]|nr:cupredoxin domain-containing protein [Candidatus Pelagibacter sp.]
MKKIILLFILIPSISFGGTINMIGEKGNPAEVSKVVTVKMYDNYYEPNKFEIKKNQTIKFIVYNYGELVHEFNIATKAMHFKHQKEMMKMVENEILLVDRIDKKKMKELSKKDHSMSHSHSNSVLLEPNQSAEIIWKFNTNADLEMACNVPGHYESGMIAKINEILD